MTVGFSHGGPDAVPIQIDTSNPYQFRRIGLIPTVTLPPEIDWQAPFMSHCVRNAAGTETRTDSPVDEYARAYRSPARSNPHTTAGPEVAHAVSDAPTSWRCVHAHADVVPVEKGVS